MLTESLLGGFSQELRGLLLNKRLEGIQLAGTPAQIIREQ